MSYEVRRQGDELDEVVATNPASVHIERMDECAWWVLIEMPDGTNIHINVGAVNPRAKGEASIWFEGTPGL